MPDVNASINSKATGALEFCLLDLQSQTLLTVDETFGQSCIFKHAVRLASCAQCLLTMILLKTTGKTVIDKLDMVRMPTAWLVSVARQLL